VLAGIGPERLRIALVCDWFLPRMLPSELVFISSLLASGVGVILVLMLVPGGLAEIVYRVRDNLLRRVANRRGIHVPSLVADSRVPEQSAEEERALFGTDGAKAGTGSATKRPRSSKRATKSGAST
jgi:hypothetical protein